MITIVHAFHGFYGEFIKAIRQLSRLNKDSIWRLLGINNCLLKSSMEKSSTYCLLVGVSNYYSSFLMSAFEIVLGIGLLRRTKSDKLLWLVDLLGAISHDMWPRISCHLISMSIDSSGHFMVRMMPIWYCIGIFHSQRVVTFFNQKLENSHVNWETGINNALTDA